MSAPAFSKGSGKERERPTEGALGLYLHVPFCNYACTFCFYAKRIGASREQMERYVKTALRELAWVEPGTRLSQLYVGGGTPTALPAELLDEILAAVFERVQNDGSEVHTVEGSPESITPAHVDVLRGRGIERVSMGVQSLQDGVLDAVHRRHAGEAALAACDLLLENGLIVNVDLIYGLPGQTQEDLRRDFSAMADRGVHSVTLYNLRVNERTPVGGTLAPEERLDLMRLVTWRAFIQRTAAELGFVQTRWHTFRRQDLGSTAPPRAAQFRDMTGHGNQFGVGVSARSRLGATVYRNHPDLKTYLERVEAGQSPVEEVFPLDDEAQKIRFIGQTLGDGQALERSAYALTFDRSFDDDFGAALERLREAELLQDDGHRIQLAEAGKLVYDLITFGFYPEHVRSWLGTRQEKVGRGSRKASARPMAS